jgi:UDP-N-acetylglucosamine 4,6-dehydratase
MNLTNKTPDEFNFLENLNVLITGGTGSLGNELIKFFLREVNFKKLIIFSRDELKQSEMKKIYKDERLRWFIGDIRDLERLKLAFYQVDIVIHAAALKQVDTGEYNPMEFVKTNILGSQNIISAAIDQNVPKIINLSTDKASSPINLYGATKLTADKLFIAANNYSQNYGVSFSVVRYGNVMASRGSVIPFFKKLIDKNESIPVTDLKMTRFWISISDAAQFVIDSLKMMQGRELYVPKIPSMKIIDLVKALDANAKIHEIGLRPGEKLHEEMISEEDLVRTYSINDRRLVVFPNDLQNRYKNSIINLQKYESKIAYRSNTNEEWLKIDDIRRILQISNGE